MYVEALHTRVPGRARFRAAGLRRSEAAGDRIEKELPCRKGIYRVSVSVLTGKVLVHFDPALGHGAVQQWLTEVLEEAARSEPAREPGGAESAKRKTGSGPARKRRRERRSERCRKYAGLEDRPVPDWYLLEPEAVCARAGTDLERGLSRSEAAERLKEYGPNALPEAASRSGFSIFLGQFQSLPVALLGAAAGLSVVTAGVGDAVVIMGVVVANAVIGYFTESEAERTIDSLKKLGETHAEVVREGEPTILPVEDVAAGDLLALRAGARVPADARVIESADLQVDESSLTGESLPVEKTSKRLADPSLPLPARVNMVYRGTVVTGGRGRAVVAATGERTEAGRLQTLLEETSAPETPLSRQLGRVGDQLVLASGAVCGVVFGMGFWRGYGLVQMARMAVSLAAAAVPEGLPAAATTTLSLGIRRMKERHVLIRRLEAVETLGAVQTVCFDKTGTVTWNRMQVMSVHAGGRHYDVKDGFLLDGEPFEAENSRELMQLLRVGAICSEVSIDRGDGGGGPELRGSSTETALVRLAMNADIDVKAVRKAHPLLQVNGRSEGRLYMSTLHRSEEDRLMLALKGSPEEVLERCDRRLENGRSVELTVEDREEIRAENGRMAARALRVLGFAYAEPEAGERPREEKLVWLGLVGMADPVRENVEELIELFHRAGIQTIMLTGDQSATARAVAEQLGLSGDAPVQLMDAAEMGENGDELDPSMAEKVTVYSRVSPAHKLKIVRALQKAGRVVAMTGDGINDSPALKAADVGIAMGRSGTDVAREVADVVLQRDNLETLVISVRDGRTTYNNLRKSVHFFLSTNMSEIMVMFTAVAGGIGSPLNAMQLLWINIISDIFPGLALSLEPPEPDVLDRPPRDPSEPLIAGRDYRRMARESAVISGGALAAYGYGLARYGIGAGAGSVAFHSLTIGQLLHALSCRSESHTVFDARPLQPNRYLNAALGGSLALQGLTAFVPGVRRFLGLAPVGLLDLAVIGATSLGALFLNDAAKGISRNRTVHQLRRETASPPAGTEEAEAGGKPQGTVEPHGRDDSAGEETKKPLLRIVSAVN
jgi:Ca2+-transporting ATPase